VCECGERPECPDCHGTGRRAITGCPWKLIDEHTADVIRMAGFWKKGIPPVAGGYLDQTPSMTEACELIWHLQDVERAKQDPWSLLDE